ncbi:MAG: amidohydrolase family protein, partial [Lachnospiraceae bacterium]|nr:amidohydrolase family protein [Lachnospiraceae bacterium]
TGCSMPMTVRKMTGAIADRFALRDRGYLKEGYFADITVFDESAIKAATPDQGRPFGIDKVFVNGELVLDDGRLDTDALKSTGRLLKV